jgi:O-antigen ligase/tetratricopeptide (TPR) repeat protein
MKVDKILFYGTLGALFAVLFVPLVVSGSMFFPFITGKNFLFRILVEIVTGGWVILTLRNPIFRPRFSWILAAAGSFLLIIGLADVLSENPAKSFWSNFERMEGWVTLLHLFAYLVVAGSMLSSQKLWDRFLQTSIGVSVIISFYGILQLMGALAIHQGSTRLDATLGNATYLAIYLIFHIFLAAYFALRKKTPLRWLYGTIAVLELFVLYHTATRGAILGILGGALLTALLIALLEREKTYVRKTAFGIIAVVIIVVGGFFAVKDQQWVLENPVLNRFATISLEERTTQSRFLVWNMAWQGFQERPVLGWGQESFNYVFNKYYVPEMYNQEPWFDRAHNVFFDWLVSGGILGLLSYLSLFLAALFVIWFRSGMGRTEASIFTGLLAAYFFHNIFVFDNIVSFIFFFTVLAFVHARSVALREPTEQLPASDGTVRLVAPLVLVVVVFSFYFFNVKGILTARTLLQALSPQETITENLNFYKKALAYGNPGYLGQQEVREQLLQAAGTVRGLDVELSLKQDFYTTSRTAMQELLDRQPNDARLQVFMGSFLTGYGFYDDGLAYLNRAHDLSPGKQSIWFEIGVNRLQKGETEAALAAFKAAFDAEPKYEEARKLYAIGAIYARQFDLAQQLLSELPEGAVVGDERFIRAYMDAQQYDEVISILTKRVEANPDDTQTRVSLAAAYLASGDRERAISEVQIAIDRNPEFKAQGEELIGQIRSGTAEQ